MILTGILARNWMISFCVWINFFCLANAVEQLQQRTWLIHWSLFVFFNHDKGRDGIIDMFFQPAYINTIQTTCPHVLRYLTTAVITNKRRRNVLKDLVRVIEQVCSVLGPLPSMWICTYVSLVCLTMHYLFLLHFFVGGISVPGPYHRIPWMSLYSFRLWRCTNKTAWMRKSTLCRLLFGFVSRRIHWKCAPICIWNILPYSSVHQY